MRKIIDTVLFITSRQPVIDRGWDFHEAEIILKEIGFHTKVFEVNSNEDIKKQVVNSSDNILVWPNCYTIGECYGGKYLVELLDEIDIPYIGASKKSLLLNSKIYLKNELQNSAFETPKYFILNDDNIDKINLKYPLVVKSEYSCDSIGVIFSNSLLDVNYVYNYLIENYKQKVFVEEYERHKEYTVSCIKYGNKKFIAPMEMIIDCKYPIIDTQIKSNNNLLAFSKPEYSISIELINMVSRFVDDFNIDGHFRLDILKNIEGTYHFIDLNFLPQMHFNDHELSYFPASFNLFLGFTPVNLISVIINSAKLKFDFIYPDYIENKLNNNLPILEDYL